jgi:hypothetical protein
MHSPLARATLLVQLTLRDEPADRVVVLAGAVTVRVGVTVGSEATVGVGEADCVESAVGVTVGVGAGAGAGVTVGSGALAPEPSPYPIHDNTQEIHESGKTATDVAFASPTAWFPRTSAVAALVVAVAAIEDVAHTAPITVRRRASPVSLRILEPRSSSPWFVTRDPRRASTARDGGEVGSACCGGGGGHPPVESRQPVVSLG